MAAAPSGTVYWVGTDGNVYVKGPGGNGAAVQNFGQATSQAGANGIEAKLGSIQGTQISDPNAPPQTVAQTASSGSGTTFDDKSNDIAQQNAGLSAVGTQTSTGISATEDALAKLFGQYDTEASSAATSAKANSDQNSVNLSKNEQTALVNAAQGRQGLYSTLASLGALNGSGITLATDAVQKGANDDLSGAADNYDTNQQSIDSALGTFNAEDKERRDDATTDAQDAEEAVQNEGAKDTLGYYQNLSNDYAAEGDSTNASKYSNLAASLFPTIASTTVPAAGPSYSAAAYTAPTLASYLSGNQDTSVSSTPSNATGGGPGLVATTVKKKVATPVLATA